MKTSLNSLKRGLIVASGLLLAGCELQEVTIVEVDPTVVAEVYVQIGGGQFGASQIVAFLHSTLDGTSVFDAAVPGATITVSAPGSGSVELGETAPERCLVLTNGEEFGSCYHFSQQGPPSATFPFGPGDLVELTIDLPSGDRMISQSRIPGDFQIEGIEDGLRCMVPPDTELPIRWTESPGTWAYINETTIFGLRAALEPRGIEVDEDPLQLLGLSVSSDDTEILFPSEFGIFDRFDLDQDVATALQNGLPAGTMAPVTIAATDRNYVNWARGGNFNPSGQVRVPSIQGDGTGVFATLVVRGFQAFSGPDAGQAEVLPLCQGS